MRSSTHALRAIGGSRQSTSSTWLRAAPRRRAQDAAQDARRGADQEFTAEISSSALVEMTLQNVTEGVRETMTARCPTATAMA